MSQNINENIKKEKLLTKSQIAGVALSGALIISSLANLAASDKARNKMDAKYEDFKASNAEYIDYMTNAMAEANQDFVDGKIDIAEVNKITSRLANDNTVEGCFKLFASNQEVEEMESLKNKASVNRAMSAIICPLAGASVGLVAGSIISDKMMKKAKTKETEVESNDNEIEM